MIGCMTSDLCDIAQMGNCVAKDKTALFNAAFSNRLAPGKILSSPHLFCNY